MRIDYRERSWTRVQPDCILQAEKEGRWTRHNPVPVEGEPIRKKGILIKVSCVVIVAELFIVMFLLGKVLVPLVRLTAIYECILERYENLILIFSATRSWAFPN